MCVACTTAYRYIIGDVNACLSLVGCFGASFRYTDFREINLGHYTSGPVCKFHFHTDDIYLSYLTNQGVQYLQRPMVLVYISLRRSLAGHAFRQATDDHRYIYAYAGVCII